MGLFCLRLRKPLWENGFAGRPQVAYSIVDGKDLSPKPGHTELFILFILEIVMQITFRPFLYCR